SSAKRGRRSPSGRRSLLATTSRSASAIWRALSGRARKVASPFTASTRVVTPASASRDERSGSATSACRMGAGAARHDVAQRIDEIAAQGAADAAAVDEDGVPGQRLVKQMVEPDLAPFVDDHQRVGERRRAQGAFAQRGLAGAEKTGDDMKADRVAARHDRRSATPAALVAPGNI